MKLENRLHIAKKTHICDVCLREIKPGQQYLRQTSLVDAVLIGRPILVTKIHSLQADCFEVSEEAANMQLRRLGFK